MHIRLSEHFTCQKLIILTFPSVIMLVFTSIYGVVDGFFVSNYVGKSAFTAVNFIMPFLMVVGSVGFMFGTGGGALIAKTLGEGQPTKANRLFSLVVYTSILSGLALAALGREKQKDFCAYLEEFLRKVMMHREGLASIADALPSEREAVARFCPVFHDSFYRKSFNAIEEARQSIEANVNAKMIFCNLSNMLFAINNF